ncbi:MAG: nucleotide exchange factor GrpE [Lentisphaeria bacterium]|nr:nucleotide exchange factor GrpE [Lentisphaeria bacterium]
MKQNAEAEAPAEEKKETVQAPETAATEEKAEKKKEETPEEKIAKLEKAILELQDTRLRLIAEMDNLRKRSAKDLETTRYNVMTDTLHPFFQVFDHFSMAVAATETSSNMQMLLEGMKMIRTEFDRAFSDLGIEQIDATGKEFDPLTQEAMSQEASDTVPAGTVIRQWSFGYKLGNHLLKPACVVVSSGPEQK